jgi:hypothetical protein
VSLPPETRYARSRDGSIGYQVVGSGPIDLVFVPWWGTNVDVMWEEPSIARFLSRLINVNAPLLFPLLAGGIVSFHADFNESSYSVFSSDALPTKRHPPPPASGYDRRVLERLDELSSSGDEAGSPPHS